MAHPRAAARSQRSRDLGHVLLAFSGALKQSGELADKLRAVLSRQMLTSARTSASVTSVNTSGMVSGRGKGRDQSVSRLGSPLGFTQVSHPTRSIASMSASIRDRLIALALYRMASATPEADETHPQSHSNANPISLLERLYRLRLVSAGILWRGG
jgi:hypothetical protein